MNLTNDEKYAMLLEGCQVVAKIADRIKRMAECAQTFKRAEPETDALNTALDVIAPYVCSLVESEDDLGRED